MTSAAFAAGWAAGWSAGWTSGLGTGLFLVALAAAGWWLICAIYRRICP